MLGWARPSPFSPFSSEKNWVSALQKNFLTMPREPKSLGVKILWIWTFGTAAILVTNAMRTRIRDMEAFMNAEQQQQQQQQQHDAATSDSSLADTLSLTSDSIISDDKD